MSSRIVESAFMMWSNVGATEEIERAVLHIPPHSDLWGRILLNVANGRYL